MVTTVLSGWTRVVVVLDSKFCSRLCCQDGCVFDLFRQVFEFVGQGNKKAKARPSHATGSESLDCMPEDRHVKGMSVAKQMTQLNAFKVRNTMVAIQKQWSRLPHSVTFCNNSIKNKDNTASQTSTNQKRSNKSCKLLTLHTHV